jgi:hypothetical protein
VGLAEQPRAGAVSPGERAACVPEELGLGQRVQQGRAVEAHVGPLGARARAHDRLGDPLLAGTALAEDHRERHEREDGHRTRAPAEKRREDALPRVLDDRLDGRIDDRGHPVRSAGHPGEASR